MNISTRLKKTGGLATLAAVLSLNPLSGCKNYPIDTKEIAAPTEEIIEEVVIKKDEETPIWTTLACYLDEDGDKFPVKSDPVYLEGYYFGKNSLGCPQGTAVAWKYNGKIRFDCDDHNEKVNPAAIEKCNGIDDNCNGKIDENLVPESCFTPCGSGKTYCKDGKMQGCDAPQPKKEICDNKDNDCNGKTDEDLTRKCYNACQEEGLEKCLKGKWKDCQAPKIKDEICNNIDDDCDGKTDEGLEEKCYSLCGEGKITCLKGKYNQCNAPEPKKEICNGKDDDCDGLTDELPECCLSGNTKNEIYCPNGSLKEQDVCINFLWEHEIYLKDCPCKDGETKNKVYCPTNELKEEDECLGGTWQHKIHIDKCPDCKEGETKNKVYCPANELKEEDKCLEGTWQHKIYLDQCPECKDGSFKIPGCKICEDGLWKTINQSAVGKACQGGGCCSDSNKQQYECYKGKIIEGCPCRTSFGSYDSRGNSFYFEEASCPEHQFCDMETLITLISKNSSVLPAVAWINWYNYGYPPKKEILLPFQTGIFEIEESMMPKEGTEIQLCNSASGCSEKIYLGCGDKKELTASPMPFKTLEKCNPETSVAITFRNHKTLDLEAWVNWDSAGYPPLEKAILKPGEDYTFSIHSSMLPRDGAKIYLCTSSYGCSQEIFLKCGDKKEFFVDWALTNTSESKNKD